MEHGADSPELLLLSPDHLPAGLRAIREEIQNRAGFRRRPQRDPVVVPPSLAASGSPFCDVEHNGLGGPDPLIPEGCRSRTEGRTGYPASNFECQSVAIEVFVVEAEL
jgi:hypothetical protein